MEISNLTMGRKNGRIFPPNKRAFFTLGYKCASKGKEEIQPIKDWRKIEEKKKKRKKEKIQKGSLDQTMFKQMCRIVKSKKKGKATWLKPKGCMKQSSSWLPTKSLCPLLLRGEPKRKRKRKNKKKNKPFPRKSPIDS